MAAYTSKKLRNVCIAGHGTTGKTTLTESMLLNMGVLNRQGAVEDGNTVSDFTKEEKERGISISTAYCSAEHNGAFITIADTPGYFDFAGEQYSAIPFSESVILTLKASVGLDAGTEKAFTLAKKYGKPVAFFVTEMDRDNVDPRKALKSIEENLGITAAPATYPSSQGQDMNSVVDILSQNNIVFSDGKKSEEKEVPSEIKDEIEEMNLKLMEAVAESDDELMEKYFEEGELSAEEVKNGLVKAFSAGEIFPVFFGAPNKGVGVSCLLDAISDYFPSPVDNPVTNYGENSVEIMESEEVKGLFIKVNNIPQFGEVYVFKLFSGEISSGDTIYNLGTDSQEKVGQLYTVNGKERNKTDKAVPGQICATVKLKATKTGDQFSDSKDNKPYDFNLIEMPEAIVRGAFEAESKDDADKLGTALKRVKMEDPSFKFAMNPELKQLMVDGLGELHLQVIRNKVMDFGGINVNIKEPRIPYRETIKGRSEVRYRHKKQSGGAGQFAEVNIVLEPTDEQFEFVDDIFGGAISNRFIPAVEKGITEVMEQGIFSGNKFINCKVTLNDGKEHSVDSSEMAFKIAASQAFKQAAEQAKPVILEPVYNIKVTVPEEYAGTVIGDISSKRGKPQGMEASGKYQIVKAQVPLKELHGYSTNLRSMSNGRGTYTIEFSHYAQVPGDIQKDIIEAYKKSQEK